jgi:hypothetical protein
MATANDHFARMRRLASDGQRRGRSSKPHDQVGGAGTAGGVIPAGLKGVGG